MKVLLVEDDALLKSGIQEALQRDGWQCDAVASVADAEEWLHSSKYSLILLDLGLPDGDGLKLLTRWRKQSVTVPVIILTARDEIQDRIIGLDSGADDYLVKPFALSEMLARVRSVLRRSEGQSSNTVQVGRLILDLNQKTACLNDDELQLVGREFTLLCRLVLRADQVVTRELLFNDAYSWADQIGSNTLEVYIHHLRQKLPPKTIETVRGQGYRLRSSCLLSV